MKTNVVLAVIAVIVVGVVAYLVLGMPGTKMQYPTATLPVWTPKPTPKPTPKTTPIPCSPFWMCDASGNPLPTVAPAQDIFQIKQCSQVGQFVGSEVVCQIPRAYCSYQPNSAGQPTFCNDVPYPNHNFTLVIWGSDWSLIDGDCVVIEGPVSMYQGKPQIVFQAADVNVSPCK
jgi:hypothetical protein